jgi:putative GTP pyrophosphokinase
MSNLVADYTHRFNTLLVPLDDHLQEFLESVFGSHDAVCMILTRPKKIDSFMKKAERLDPSGKPKYNDPLAEIQDQLGGLIVTRFLSDVPSVEHIVEKKFRRIERKTIEPESDCEFGYVGRHFVLFLPTDVSTKVEGEGCPTFFELQIKTLFQFAWSETNHAIGYKRGDDISPGQTRMSAYVAAQAWGADRAVEELRRGFERE